MRRIYVLVVLLLASALLVACGGGAAPSGGGGGNAANGEKLFAQQVIGAQAGCKTCHSLEAGKQVVGPSMAGIGSRAGGTVAGKSAEDYLKQSILEPNAHLVSGFSQGIMQSYQKDLNEQQINDLVAYMLTLK